MKLYVVHLGDGMIFGRLTDVSQPTRKFSREENRYVKSEKRTSQYGRP